MSNLKNTGLQALMYSDDYNQQFCYWKNVMGSFWTEILIDQKYVSEIKTLQCPVCESDPKNNRMTFAAECNIKGSTMNKGYYTSPQYLNATANISKLEKPTRTPAFYDSWNGSSQYAIASICSTLPNSLIPNKTYIYFCHSKKANIAFWDGHVAALDPAALKGEVPIISNSDPDTKEIFQSLWIDEGYAKYYDLDNTVKDFQDL